MKAMLSHTPGGPETLILTEISLKEPKEGEICIAVKAAGVNFPDTLIIRDLYQIKPPRPFAPGGEVAGIIESIGLNVKDFNVGDRVLAVPGHGGFVTHINVPAIQQLKFLKKCHLKTQRALSLHMVLLTMRSEIERQ